MESTARRESPPPLSAGERDEPNTDWRAGVLYVVGHQRPDMDAIASAMAFAWTLRQQGEANAEAARAGPLPPQAQWALRRFDLDPPPLLLSVAPTFAHVSRPLESLSSEAALSAALPLMAAAPRPSRWSTRVAARWGW